ncbi:MAG: hypothetical protein ACE5EO_08345 [Candidatus Krumholzibacteriia bacterium]
MKRFMVPLLATVLLLAGCGEDMTLPATGTIYGDLVFVDGTPADGILVLVEGTGLSAVSDSRGRFIIGDVLAVDVHGMGKYYTVRGMGMQGTTSVGFLVGHFKVKGQQSYSVGTVTVPETGTITGTLQLEGMTDHSGVAVHLEGTSISTVSRADGSYTLDLVPAHSGYVVPCRREGFAAMTIHEMDVGGQMQPIRVDPGQTTDLGGAVLNAVP